MTNSGPPITVFTKPWQDLEIGKLADLIAALGFDGIELPVRNGFQVETKSIETSLANAVNVFKDLKLNGKIRKYTLTDSDDSLRLHSSRDRIKVS